MGSIDVFLDSDVLLNWLCREVDPNSQFELWKAPYEIIKGIEEDRIKGRTSLVNLMEIRFVLRRKKKWAEEEITDTFARIQGMSELTVIVPQGKDMISAFNLQAQMKLDPFDALYLGMSEECAHIVTRDRDFMDIANSVKRGFALSPEDFLEKVMK
jgi:predicted nucleic acid-binding protein